ncbi:hypothetical protein [Paraburkholderia caribensis]|uniref:hypothetical protein n=1 Tax=Paraburkholderia caribensis TaxID=75105 RepID=UPI001CC607EF|nr:hypothetical protein [Paraburkholderia caribensis]
MSERIILDVLLARGLRRFRGIRQGERRKFGMQMMHLIRLIGVLFSETCVSEGAKQVMLSGLTRAKQLSVGGPPTINEASAQ